MDTPTFSRAYLNSLMALQYNITSVNGKTYSNRVEEFHLELNKNNLVGDSKPMQDFIHFPSNILCWKEPRRPLE